MKIEDVIEIVESIQIASNKLSYEDFCQSSRYPYTYAWDYVRQHQAAFYPLVLGDLSRADVGWTMQAHQTPEEVRDVAEYLALAYWRENYA